MIANKTHFLKQEITYDLIDMSGVLHHPNYLVLSERGRTAALENAGLAYQEMWSNGNGLAVFDIHCQYLKPILMGQKVTVLTRSLQLSKVIIELEHRIIPTELIHTASQMGFVDTHSLQFSKKKIIFSAIVKLVSVSADTLKPIRFSEKFIQALNIT